MSHIILGLELPGLMSWVHLGVHAMRDLHHLGRVGVVVRKLGDHGLGGGFWKLLHEVKILYFF